MAIGKAGLSLAETIDWISFGVIERRLAKLLARRFGRWVSTDELIAAAYGDRPDGGPENAKNAVKAHISNIRRKLAPHGIAIAGVGYSGRRMEAIP